MLRSVCSRVATLLPGTSSGLGAMFSRGMATAKRRVVVMGRARRGLYDGKHISFGNKISFAGNKCAARAPAASLSGWLASSTSHPLHRSQNATLLEAEHCEQAVLEPNLPAVPVLSGRDLRDQEGQEAERRHRPVPADDAQRHPSLQEGHSDEEEHHQDPRESRGGPPHKPKLQGGASVRCERGRRARGVAGGAAGECVPVSRAAQGLYDEAAASPRRARAAGAAAMSARPGRSVWPVGGGRLNMFVCLYTDREKPEKNGQSAAPAASLPTPGNVLRRAVRNLKPILRLLLPLS